MNSQVLPVPRLRGNSDSGLDTFFSLSFFTLPNSGLIPPHLDGYTCFFMGLPAGSLSSMGFPPPQIFSTLLSCSDPPMAPRSGFHHYVTVFGTLHTLAWPTFLLCSQSLPCSPSKSLHLHLHTSSLGQDPGLRISSRVFGALFCRLHYTPLPLWAPLSVRSVGPGKVSRGLLRLKAFYQNSMPSRVAKNYFPLFLSHQHT